MGGVVEGVHRAIVASQTSVAAEPGSFSSRSASVISGGLFRVRASSHLARRRVLTGAGEFVQCRRNDLRARRDHGSGVGHTSSACRAVSRYRFTLNAIEGSTMNALTTALISGCFALAASGAIAQDTMKKDNMAKDMPKKAMTLQECKDHMAMAKKDGMKKDDAMMHKDQTCAEMMKKDGMAKDAMMKKDGAASDPVKK
jgi:pentapeptide MXKDX repeat protein